MRRARTRLKTYLLATCLAVICLAALVFAGRALAAPNYHTHGHTIHYAKRVTP